MSGHPCSKQFTFPSFASSEILYSEQSCGIYLEDEDLTWFKENVETFGFFSSKYAEALIDLPLQWFTQLRLGVFISLRSAIATDRKVVPPHTYIGTNGLDCRTLLADRGVPILYNTSALV